MSVLGLRQEVDGPQLGVTGLPAKQVLPAMGGGGGSGQYY